MGVRFLAEEVYRWTRQVEDLEKRLAALRVDGAPQDRARVEVELLQARQELARARAVLSSKKEPVKI
jgi:hypothetical protein